MSFIYGAASVSAVIGFIPHIPQVGIYFLFIIFVVYNLSKPHRYNPWLAALLAYIPLNLLAAQPDSVFLSWPRYVMFALLLTCVSPLLDGKYHRKSRHRMFLMVLWTCSFLAIGSFFGRFLGLNYMVASTIDSINHAGLFGGLTPHSMLLGPISGIGGVFMSYHAFRTKKKLYWLLAALCLFSILFSASRSSLMASVVGIVLTIYKLSGNASKFLRIGIIAGAIAASTFPLWDSALDGMIQKNVGNTSGIDTSSRQGKWDMRIEEFVASPLIGVGFVSVDSELAREDYNNTTGAVEPGSSWLSVFSMLGLIGAVILLPFLCTSYITVWKQTDEFNAIVTGVLSLMYVHMIAEGYIFSGGSFLCFVLWLTLGVANDSKSNTSNK